MDNPNLVLSDTLNTNATNGQTVLNFIKFDVTTGSTADLNGGGISNVAFLGGKEATIAT